jgi:HD-like signal output (HDOD) protein
VDRKTEKQDGIQDHCRSHLASIVSEGLKPLPPCVFELDVLLNEPVIDLEKVIAVLDSDPEFARRVLQLSNAILSRSNASAQTIADAVVLLEPNQFQAVALLCAVTEFGERESRDRNAEELWPHSVQIAILSEEIAAQSNYPVRGTAFVAGLLHDIGFLPLLIVAREQEKTFEELASIEWREKIELERELFGLDHCQVGRWMAKSWQFSPSLTDAVLHHHDPDRAEIDSHLAEIVFAAEFHYSSSFRKPVN